MLVEEAVVAELEISVSAAVVSISVSSPALLMRPSPFLSLSARMPVLTYETVPSKASLLRPALREA